MTYGSVCSGIEAVSVAWEPLGFRPAWFSEIDPFCNALLAYHYPGVRNYGDFTTIPDDAGPIDILAGGTPCQSFSVAGRRGGLDDDRGNLAIEFCRLAGRLRPRWIVWENVPGVLSSNGGRDFGAIVGALAELGYGCAWRVLDAQFFGVPQRRRRVFVVGYLGDWRRATAVLLEREGLCRDTPARQEKRKEVAGTLGGGSGARGWCDDTDRMTFVPAFGGNNTAGPIDIATAYNAHGGSGRMDFETETFCVDVAPPLMAGAIPGMCVDMRESLATHTVTHTLRADGFDASEDGTGRGTPRVAIPILEAGARTGVSTSDPRAGIGIGEPGDPMFILQRGKQHAVAFSAKDAVCVQESQTGVREYETAGTMRSDAPGSQPGGSLIRHQMAVRRLTPRECERLQGFPDDYTLIPYRGKPAADGPRYRAIGNSMCVQVMRWIGKRILAVDSLQGE